MRVVVIGGTGHVGTYLIPRLVAGGNEVVVISRSRRAPYLRHPAWNRVRTITLDRESGDKDGSFAKAVARENPDVVVDMICFTRAQAERLVEALRGRVQHLLVCGTIWIHGPSVAVPTPETESLDAFGTYGTNKLELTRYLLLEARRNGFPATVIHPGHIVGSGWIPINPLGNLSLTVFERIARGEPLHFPTLGFETLHHVHADDVAALFQCAIERWSASVGEDFHAVSEAAVTLRGYAAQAAGWFGRDIALEFRSPDEVWTRGLTDEEVSATWDHIARSPNASMEKARRLLGFVPRYSSFEAIREAVSWLQVKGSLPGAVGSVDGADE
ncbi:MAG TPA: NAD-dependent epimerase/dehydratase family protein [Spirochaetia bacterium]|nr:NAD-dependent epimerase/dehydratase family protein [Spirochaetia bacterium]